MIEWWGPQDAHFGLHAALWQTTHYVQGGSGKLRGLRLPLPPDI